MPKIGNDIELKWLGLIIRSDLKWSSNTEHIISKAYKRLWMVRRLKALGADTPKLVDVYIKQVRSIMELAVPAWHSSLTGADTIDIERVQKSALQVILGKSYTTYNQALMDLNLVTLQERRILLCEKFSKKAIDHPKHTNWFKPNTKTTITRQKGPKYCPVVSRTTRFENSPLRYLINLLNK